VPPIRSFVLTGTTIRQHCPDQAGNAMAQAQNASA